ncbi:LLM class flavin-dependent oxidoreductase [Jonesiaceae bacterium BS-20]|uniref:LLM class flavin-dependent oxidoreductase n=1 Tax=Jonesiaceae bacterium BS-20 TaxID=3120821 RepID=A0AAU7DUV3_9MICO
MTDYGRALEFGSFITPAAGSARGVIELAKVSQRAGLDFATFQDHPYQPAFFDTWTLLSYLAAQTSTIRLAANVHNLPLRPPAVLARSAASLDILSGGRIELGLGAGGFWDAIEAMGGGRLTPGQSVSALSEAIDVIRGIWDVGNRERFVYEGEFYQINGAKRGPAPAHDMEIWLGGYKPRMLRLIGTKATGWLPSLSYLPDLKDLSVANAAIDQAALKAGRDPKVIRRLLNVGGQITNAPTSKPLVGPVQQWIDDLVSMALEHGMDTFILGGDSVQMLEIYGNEIIPAVREIVAQERGTNGLGA